MVEISDQSLRTETSTNTVTQAPCCEDVERPDGPASLLELDYYNMKGSEEHNYGRYHK